MLKINPTNYHNFVPKNPMEILGSSAIVEKLIKDVKLSNLYGTFDVGKVKMNGKTFDVQTTGGQYFGIKDGKKTLGNIIMSDRMYDGKTCLSVAEVRNLADEKGVGTKLMQIAYKAHKDSGKTGEFRAHDVILEAEEFYQKLGFIEDPKRAEQWYLPFENEHILENYNGGL
jgi:hypothetical protein